MPSAPNLFPHYRRSNFPQNPPPHPLSRSMKTTKGPARCTLRPGTPHHSTTTDNLENNKKQKTTQQPHDTHPHRSRMQKLQPPKKQRMGPGISAQIAAKERVTAPGQAALTPKRQPESHLTPPQFQRNRPHVRSHLTGQQARPTKTTENQRMQAIRKNKKATHTVWTVTSPETITNSIARHGKPFR